MDLVELFAHKPPLFDCTPAGLTRQIQNSMRYLENECLRPGNQPRIAQMSIAYNKLLEEINALGVENV